MRGLDTRGGLITVITAGVVALGGLGAFVAMQVIGKPSVEPLQPTANGAISPGTRAIVVRTGSGPLQDLKVTLDGRDVTSRIRGAGGNIVLRAPGLSNGPHTMSVSYSTGNLVSPSTSRTWGFVVDRTPPALSATVPVGNGVNSHSVRIAGTAERGSTINITWEGGLARAVAEGPTGAWATTATLPEGLVDLRVAATDIAGNTIAKGRRLIVDTKRPRFTLVGTKNLFTLTTTAEPIVYGRVANEDPRLLTFGARVNGEQITPISGRDVVAVGTSTAPYTDAASSGNGTSLQLSGKKFALGIGTLPEGRNTITVWVRDAGGNVARKTFTSFVDTQSQFGTSQLTEGAKGTDVQELQVRLAQAGVWKGGSTGTYHAKTVRAVKRYQKRHGFTVNGRVDSRTLGALVGKIVVRLNRRTLTLYRDGKAVKTYPIAVGMPAYPTPIGTFKIVNKQMNPTWTPPESPWAAGLGPIPAGPGNPLGTRWIGTSATAVGIHGTYADWSIGSAASHGCLRMHIPDVEALYELVSVGMPVEITN